MLYICPLCPVVTCPGQTVDDGTGNCACPGQTVDVSNPNYKVIDGSCYYFGAKYLVFVSSRSFKMRELSFAQFAYFLGQVFIFQFLNDKIHNYVKQNITVNFIIKKLKKTQFPQKV